MRTISNRRFAARAAASFAAAVAVLILAACQRGGAGYEGKARAPDPAFVVAHSDGIVSRFADVSVVLSTGRDIAALEGRDPFRFEPALAGTVAWSADGARADFKPDRPLKAGARYRCVFDFAALGEPGNGWFSFDVIAAETGLSVEPGDPYAAADGSLSVAGVLRLADGEGVEPEIVERVVSAKSDGVSFSWEHDSDGTHKFVARGIKRHGKDSSFEISWDGAPVGSKAKGRKAYRIPKEGAFELLSVSGPEPGATPGLTVAFSEPVDKSQDLRGLIRADGAGPLRYEVDGGLVKVYASMSWPESVTVEVERGVRSASGEVLAIPTAAAVKVGWEKPELRFAAGGVIVPSTEGTKVVLEAKNLSGAVVEALRVYGDNMLQFLQVNELDGSKELKRVGDVVWRKEIDLGWTDDKKNEWVRYALDLTPLLAAHPDGMFQLRVAFGHEHVKYVSPNELPSLGKWKFPPVTINDDTESSYWDGYEAWFDWNQYYRYRDDPSHPAFYVQRYGRDRTARRNVLVSDVGISAKLDVDGRWHVVASDLRTARPLAGARVSTFSYSMRELSRATTDGDGLALIQPPSGEQKPFFLLVEAKGASTTRDRGYLKLTPAQALTVSHFDIGGEKADTGIKGFIYGERGVWRPGDDIHLTFVLHDRLGTLPAGHPLRFELENPLGQVVSQATMAASPDGFTYIKTGTEANAPTGTWTARVTVGGSVFTKPLKVEAVMPNRLKLKLDYGTADSLSADVDQMGLEVAWLHGAPAPELKADVQLLLGPSSKSPGNFPGYSFQDPTREAPSQRLSLFDGTLDAAGKARFPVDLAYEAEAPGMLTATFLSRAFERSGLFSSEAFSVDFHPYERYVGVKLPSGDAARGMLLTDVDHPVEILLVGKDGKPAGDGQVEVAVYKLSWRWWWEKGEESLAEQAGDIYRRLVKRDDVAVKNGRASWKLRINYPEWGRYLIRVSDKSGGHAAGSVFYIDWPGWAGRGKGEGGGSAVMLSLSTDKPKYAPGEPVKVSFPSNKEGRAFVSVERAGRVLSEGWAEAKDGTTVYEFKASAAMAPNVYVHVSFFQPHLQTKNDLPIRLYGVVPVMVDDPATRLDPVISAPASFEPMKSSRVTVSESSGKAMTYTLAIVDEGLLGITRYVTPNPWGRFYAKEASQLTSYDLYKDVAGAFAGKLQTLISIGGSEFGDAGGTRKVSRFPPVVKYLGPFTLAAGAKAVHEFDLGPYVGAVRLMVVSGSKAGAYGVKELEVPVRADLMAYMTAPRVLGPGESLKVPVSLLGFMGAGAKATVTLKVDGEAAIVGESTKSLTFETEGELSASFDLKVADRTGAVRLSVEATGPGGRTSSQTIEVPVRSSAVPVTAISAAAVAGRGKETIDAEVPGMAGTNEAWLELSMAPSIDLSGRLAYLIGYPHGCGEQTTSKAFPQLFLGDAMALTPDQAEAAKANVMSAITKLAGFQTGSGGFVFWPGSYEESTWLSVYVTHFLVMARKQGFSVPESMLGPALEYLGTKSSAWSSRQDWAKAEQAYRLYVLALAGSPDIASMNRFAEYSPFPAGAQYQLAASYALAGMKDRARGALAEAPSDASAYESMGRIYGSTLRDKAMMLDALNALGDQTRALPLYRKLAEELSSGAGYSTQELSFSLIAALPFLKSQAGSQATVRYSYDGGSGLAQITKAISRTRVPFDGASLRLTIDNPGPAQVYAKVVVTGTPAPGTESARSEGLSLSARYLDGSDASVDPARVSFGSDIAVEITVRNMTAQPVSDVALTFRAPSGWELANLRVAKEDDSEGKAPEYRYRDTRDDRVMTYFDLARGETKRFKLYVNKTYEGEFFLPAIVAEAMYDPEIFAVLPGRPLPAPRAGGGGNPNSRGARP